MRSPSRRADAASCPQPHAARTADSPAPGLTPRRPGRRDESGQRGWAGNGNAASGEARMESLFEAVGIGLLLAIAVAAAWILIRQPLR